MQSKHFSNWFKLKVSAEQEHRSNLSLKLTGKKSIPYWCTVKKTAIFIPWTIGIDINDIVRIPTDWHYISKIKNSYLGRSDWRISVWNGFQIWKCIPAEGRVPQLCQVQYIDSVPGSNPDNLPSTVEKSIHANLLYSWRTNSNLIIIIMCYVSWHM